MDSNDEWNTSPNTGYYLPRQEPPFSVYQIHNDLNYPLISAPEPRFIHKSGCPNICNKNIPNQGTRYFQDIFTTVVDMKWRWHLSVFVFGFLATWVFFAFVYYIIAVARDDINHVDDVDWNPCVENIKSFMSAFLFSVESQHTIGYGHRHITEHCPEAVTFLCLQSIVGVIIQTFMVGLILTKATRPKARQLTLVFTQKCVVCLRDGKLCLMFRIGDMRKSHILGASVKLFLLREKVTQEGERIPGHLTPLKVKIDSGEDLYLLWPAVVVHEIDEHSPFYESSSQSLCNDTFELMVIMEGVTESTGQQFQARTSYLPTEIVWGERFTCMVETLPKGLEVNFGVFNKTIKVDTPNCSVAELNRLQRRESAQSLIADTDSTCSLQDQDT